MLNFYFKNCYSGILGEVGIGRHAGDMVNREQDGAAGADPVVGKDGGNLVVVVTGGEDPEEVAVAGGGDPEVVGASGEDLLEGDDGEDPVVAGKDQVAPNQSTVPLVLLKPPPCLGTILRE